MKKILSILSGVAFIVLITLAAANAQEPEKKATETKAKTEKCCTKAESKNCPTTCDKKAKEETKKTEEKKVEKK